MPAACACESKFYSFGYGNSRSHGGRSARIFPKHTRLLLYQIVFPRFSRRGFSLPAHAAFTLGSWMGAGLFVGVGTAIATTGRLILISYAIAGLILLALVRMADRMRKRYPGTLLLTDRIEVGLSPLLANLSRCTYWCFWTILVSLEAIAAGNILGVQAGFRRVTVEIALILGTIWIADQNPRIGEQIGARFVVLKVMVLAAFILALVPHIASPHALHLAQLVRPSLTIWQGFSQIASGVALAMFSLAGVEIVHGVASQVAGEGRAASTTTLTAVRVFGLYMVAIALVLAVVRPDQVRAGFSPFTKSLRSVGYVGFARCFDAIVLMSIIAALYAAATTAAHVFAGPSEVTVAGGHNDRLSSKRVRAVLAALAITTLAAFSPASSYAFLVKLASLLLIGTYGLFAVGVYRVHRLEDDGVESGGMTLPLLVGCAVVGVLAATAQTLTASFVSFVSVLFLTFLGCRRSLPDAASVGNQASPLRPGRNI
jgi:L-asparagine transporter-like permease